MAEKQGQVSGAFYKEGLGDIVLVWGDENFGLRHILEQRAKQWGEEKALKFISHLSENIEKGQIVELEKGRVGIKTDLTTIILDKKENNNFVLTAFRDRNNKKELESLNLSQSKTFTSENAETNAKESPVTPLNQESIIPQRSENLIEKKEAYEKADFKGKCEFAKEDINEEIKALEKQKEELKRIIRQNDYNDVELEQARKILENAKEEVEGHYHIKYMQNGKEMRAFISKIDYSNQGKRLSKDEILHKIIQKTIYKDKINNIEKTSDKLKKQIKIIDEYLKKYGDNEAGAINDDIIEKFKHYDFAKDTGEGEIIIGRRQKGLYEQAQKVLNSRFLKMKSAAQKSSRDYNITYDEARKLFYKGDMSDEQKELFESVLPIAQSLKVRIRTAIREPYEDMMYSTKDASGLYRYSLNTATLKKGAGLSDTQKAQVLLHELIHSVTSRAISLHKTPLRDKMLSKTQIRAIDEIDQIYKKLYKFRKTFKLQDENGAPLYGLTNAHEMLAELSNPHFTNKLKEIGFYEKVINNIMKIILSVRDFIRLRSDKNAYEKLKQCLKDIIENYKDDFTQEYEKQNIRDFTLTSQTQKQIYTKRQELKSSLKAKINQAITNENTGEKAILTNKGIAKMLSDKAISKSVENGFSREEYLRAVGAVDELFKRAKRAFSKRDEKDKNLSIYRYNAPFENANALMTLKEYKQNGKRIYSLELENLEAVKFNPSGKDLTEQSSKSKDADTTTFHTPIDNSSESIAQKNENIPHSNPHLGAGLVGGTLNGLETDEEGNITGFDPAKFAMGFLGGSLGSKAVSMGFKHLEKNPALKEKIITELADTLAQGFDKAKAKYPLLSMLEPRYIIQNERGRKIQAKAMLKELEREQKGLYNVVYNGKNAVLIKKDLEAVDEAILFEKGTKRKGGKHIRLAHSQEPSQEGYVTKQEVVNLGANIREYLKNYEPFIDTNGARLYEWEKEGVRFRVVVNDLQTSGGNSRLPSASEEIITFYSDRNLKEAMDFKNPVLKVQEKFKFNPQKAKDLLEWHKDSSPLTKDENGLPKVFYHGTYAKFEVFKRVEKASQQGFFFTPIQKVTEQYGDTSLSTFLNIKNPFRADELKINTEADLQKWADILRLDYDKEKYKRFKKIQSTLQKVKEASLKAGLKFHSANSRGVYALSRTGKSLYIDLRQLDKETKRRQEAFKPLEELFKSLDEDLGFHYVARNEFDLVLDVLNKNDKYFYTKGRDEVKRVLEKLGYDGIILNDTIISVFNPNQIKHIDNKGLESKSGRKYFNEKSENIYYSNPHLGAGLVGGVLNGVEQDEEGNLSFNPEKFVMGFLGGSLGSKAVSKGIKWRANKVKKAYPNIAKDNPALMEQIAKRDLLTYAKNESANALTRFLNKNKLFDSTRGIFAGEKALLNEAYAPQKARLKKAKELESKGADEIEIWEKTGWYKDKDKKWKFEISQRGGELKLKFTPEDRGEDWLLYSIAPEKNLMDFLDDKELFKAYPQLKDIKIKLFTHQESADSPFTVGRYEQYAKEIKLNDENIGTDIKKAKSILYHEIQHAIQDIEGFAYGNA
ncbi:LPD23 domain-containing protein [Campylobacter upsaliensis]